MRRTDADVRGESQGTGLPVADWCFRMMVCTLTSQAHALVCTCRWMEWVSGRDWRGIPLGMAVTLPGMVVRVAGCTDLDFRL